MAHAFLSYVRENSAVVDRVAAALRSNGVKVWLDRNDLEAGAFWKDAIARAIDSGAFFIAFFSESSIERAQTYMNEELTLALGQLRLRPHDARWFIPVLIDDVQVPRWPFRPGQTLGDFQAVRLFESYDEGIAALLRGMGYDDPEVAEENLLLDLLTSRFPVQRDHAQEMLCSFENLSPRARRALVDGVFDEPNAHMQEVGAKRILGAWRLDADGPAIAARFASHPNCEVRLSAYAYLLRRKTTPVDQAFEHALAAIGDDTSDIRSVGIEFFDKKLHRFPQAIEPFGRLLEDPETGIRYQAVRVLLWVPGLWPMLASGHLAAFADLVLQRPELWRRFGQSAEKLAPVPAAFRRLLNKMAKSTDREIQNAALALIPRGRANFVAKKIAALRGADTEAAIEAAYRLGHPENQSDKAIAALEEAARSDARAHVRNAALHALRRQVGDAVPLLGSAAERVPAYPVWQRSARIVNLRGLDSLPCIKLVTLAGKFDAKIYIWKEDSPENPGAATEILDLMMGANRARAG